MLTLRRFNQEHRHCVLSIFSVPRGTQNCVFLWQWYANRKNVEKQCYGIVIGLYPGLSNVKWPQDRNPDTNSAEYSDVWNLRPCHYTPLTTLFTNAKSATLSFVGDTHTHTHTHSQLTYHTSHLRPFSGLSTTLTLTLAFERQCNDRQKGLIWQTNVKCTLIQLVHFQIYTKGNTFPNSHSWPITS
jgi:hypothetical protein